MLQKLWFLAVINFQLKKFAEKLDHMLLEYFFGMTQKPLDARTSTGFGPDYIYLYCCTVLLAITFLQFWGVIIWETNSFNFAKF